MHFSPSSSGILRHLVVGILALLVVRPSLAQTTAGPSQCASTAPPAILKGKKFFSSVTGAYIPIKGINYYPRPNAGELVQTNSIDFFTETYRSIWERDILHFQRLNVTVVRVYAVAPGEDHGAFLCALRAAGMYAIVGLTAEYCAVTKDAAPACYPPALKARGQFIIAEFARYDNVLGFLAGNEASLNADSASVNGPCQKQFARDMRAYIRGCSATMRPIPV
jgi:1,3-beta-glucanosyltransferase GAS5